MYANVDNGASQELMHRFLQEFALPSCHYLDNVQSKNGMMALAGIKPIMITGLSKVQEVFCERVVNIPDFTLHIDRSWISQSTDRPGSRLYAEVSIKGSLLSYDWFQVMDKHKTRVYHLPALVIKTLHIADQLNTVTGGSKDHVEKTNFPMSEFRIRGTYIFHLDNQHRIYFIEHHCISELLPPPVGGGEEVS
eukprot:gene8834-9741_t